MTRGSHPVTENFPSSRPYFLININTCVITRKQLSTNQVCAFAGPRRRLDKRFIRLSVSRQYVNRNWKLERKVTTLDVDFLENYSVKLCVCLVCFCLVNFMLIDGCAGMFECCCQQLFVCVLGLYRPHNHIRKRYVLICCLKFPNYFLIQLLKMKRYRFEKYPGRKVKCITNFRLEIKSQIHHRFFVEDYIPDSLQIKWDKLRIHDRVP